MGFLVVAPLAQSICTSPANIETHDGSKLVCVYALPHRRELVRFVSNRSAFCGLGREARSMADVADLDEDFAAAAALVARPADEPPQPAAAPRWQRRAPALLKFAREVRARHQAERKLEAVTKRLSELTERCLVRISSGVA